MAASSVEAAETVPPIKRTLSQDGANMAQLTSADLYDGLKAARENESRRTDHISTTLAQAVALAGGNRSGEGKHLVANAVLGISGRGIRLAPPVMTELQARAISILNHGRILN